MNDFKRDFKSKREGGSFRNSSARPSFSGGFSSRKPRQGYADKDAEIFKAECSQCHKACDVPFKPNGKKPVYCRDCFVRDDARPSNDRFQKRSFGGDRYEKPSYAPKPAVEDPRITAMQKELAAIHAKLDTLISSLQNTAYSAVLASSKNTEEAPVKKAVTKKVAKKKAA